MREIEWVWSNLLDSCSFFMEWEKMLQTNEIVNKLELMNKYLSIMEWDFEPVMITHKVPNARKTTKNLTINLTKYFFFINFILEKILTRIS